MKIYQAVEKLDDNQIDKISHIIGETPADQNVPEADAIEVPLEEREEHGDEVGELREEKLTSVSQLKPTQSQLSQMSGRTYISQLQRQLNDEKVARLRLEQDLNDLKKISSEITSQLSQMQKEKEQMQGQQ